MKKNNNINKTDISNKSNKDKTNDVILEDIIDYTEDNLELASLSFTKRLKKKLEFEKIKLSKMNQQDKTSYIINYYKWHFIIFAILVFSIVSFSQLIYRNSLPIAVRAFVINNDKSLNYNLVDDIDNDFRQYYGLNSKTRTYFQDGFKIFSEDDVSITSNELTSYETIILHIQNGDLDIIITDKNGLDFYANNGEIHPLDVSLDKEIYADIHEIIKDDIEKANGLDGTPFECAIDISNTEFVKNFDLGYEKVYLCIPGIPKDIDRATNFIRYVYGQ